MRSQRDALVVLHPERRLLGLCLPKTEPGGEHGVPGSLHKLSTFKVAAEASGYKYGELLLKAVFDQAATEGHDGLFVTVFPRHEGLRSLLEDFGFMALPSPTGLGELVMHKPLRPGPEAAGMDALDLHVRYGPPAMTLDATRAFVVPVRPRWHRVLFPDAERTPEETGALFPADLALGAQPFGNALRKAYICHAKTRRIRKGDALLFYRSGDERAVFVVGVCESVHVSGDPDEIAGVVGRQTVYTYDDIVRQTLNGLVVAIMFRQARVLSRDPITIADLLGAEVLRGHPQSATEFRSEKGVRWLRPPGRIALLSIRPAYAAAIMDGSKRVEFRRRPPAADVTHVVVYASSPVQRVVGSFDVVGLDRAAPDELWARWSVVGGIGRVDFDTYFKDSESAYAIRVGRPRSLPLPIRLARLGVDLRPPQSFQYLRDEVLARAEEHLDLGGATNGGITQPA